MGWGPSPAPGPPSVSAFTGPRELCRKCDIFLFSFDSTYTFWTTIVGSSVRKLVKCFPPYSNSNIKRGYNITDRYNSHKKDLERKRRDLSLRSLCKSNLFVPNHFKWSDCQLEHVNNGKYGPSSDVTITQSKKEGALRLEFLFFLKQYPVCQ